MLAAIDSSSPPPGDTAPSSGTAAAGLGALFERHHARVLRAAYRVTGNATDAEDVLQTVFTRLAGREGDLDLAAGEAGYLHRAAVNAALDLLRSRQRSRAVDLDAVADGLAEGDERGPERSSEGRELRRWLRRALTRVSPRAAEIFTLRYFEGYGNREIAEQLGTSQTAVAVILHRTRRRLAKELRPLVGGITS